MPRFVMTQETDSGALKEIHAPWWGPKERVVLRRLSYGDNLDLASRAVDLSETRASDENVALDKVDIRSMSVLNIVRSVVLWTDENGKELEVTEDLVAALTPEDGKFIADEVKAHNATGRRRSADEQSNFRGSDRDGLADGQSPADATAGGH